MFDAAKLAQILSLATGGGGGAEQSGILVQDIYDPAPTRGEFINKGKLVTIFCGDGSMLQVVVDTDSEVVDAVVSPPEAEESLWCEEGKLRFGVG